MYVKRQRGLHGSGGNTYDETRSQRYLNPVERNDSSNTYLTNVVCKMPSVFWIGYGPSKRFKHRASGFALSFCKFRITSRPATANTDFVNVSPQSSQTAVTSRDPRKKDHNRRIIPSFVVPSRATFSMSLPGIVLPRLAYRIGDSRYYRPFAKRPPVPGSTFVADRAARATSSARQRLVSDSALTSSPVEPAL